MLKVPKCRYGVSTVNSRCVRSSYSVKIHAKRIERYFNFRILTILSSAWNPTSAVRYWKVARDDFQCWLACRLLAPFTLFSFFFQFCRVRIFFVWSRWSIQRITVVGAMKYRYSRIFLLLQTAINRHQFEIWMGCSRTWHSIVAIITAINQMKHCKDAIILMYQKTKHKLYYGFPNLKCISKFTKSVFSIQCAWSRPFFSFPSTHKITECRMYVL